MKLLRIFQRWYRKVTKDDEPRQLRVRYIGTGSTGPG